MSTASRCGSFLVAAVSRALGGSVADEDSHSLVFIRHGLADAS